MSFISPHRMINGGSRALFAISFSMVVRSWLEADVEGYIPIATLKSEITTRREISLGRETCWVLKTGSKWKKKETEIEIVKIKIADAPSLWRPVLLAGDNVVVWCGDGRMVETWTQRTSGSRHKRGDNLRSVRRKNRRETRECVHR